MSLCSSLPQSFARELKKRAAVLPTPMRRMYQTLPTVYGFVWGGRSASISFTWEGEIQRYFLL